MVLIAQEGQVYMGWQDQPDEAGEKRGKRCGRRKKEAEMESNLMLGMENEDKDIWKYNFPT